MKKQPIQLTISLEADEVAALMNLADLEMRSSEDQARYMLRAFLLRFRYLHYESAAEEMIIEAQIPEGANPVPYRFLWEAWTEARDVRQAADIFQGNLLQEIEAMGIFIDTIKEKILTFVDLVEVDYHLLINASSFEKEAFDALRKIVKDEEEIDTIDE